MQSSAQYGRVKEIVRDQASLTGVHETWRFRIVLIMSLYMPLKLNDPVFDVSVMII